MSCLDLASISCPLASCIRTSAVDSTASSFLHVFLHAVRPPHVWCISLRVYTDSCIEPVFVHRPDVNKLL